MQSFAYGIGSYPFERGMAGHPRSRFGRRCSGLPLLCAVMFAQPRSGQWSCVTLAEGFRHVEHNDAFKPQELDEAELELKLQKEIQDIRANSRCMELACQERSSGLFWRFLHP